jgi:hypothetical protein
MPILAPSSGPHVLWAPPLHVGPTGGKSGPVKPALLARPRWRKWYGDLDFGV